VLPSLVKGRQLAAENNWLLSGVNNSAIRLVFVCWNYSEMSEQENSTPQHNPLGKQHTTTQPSRKTAHHNTTQLGKQHTTTQPSRKTAHHDTTQLGKQYITTEFSRKRAHLNTTSRKTANPNIIW
jgi:hypothetical protein